MNWLKPIQNGRKPSQALETTVTYLEMIEHKHVHAPRPSNINAALLVAHDIPLHFYRYLYFNVGIPWHWESRLRLRDEDLGKAIHNPVVEITVLYIDGTPAGFFEVNRAKNDTHDLAYFGMMPHVLGRGLGKWFLASAIETCWAREPGRITVNTCTLDHPAALPLYQKFGFKPYKQAAGRVHPMSESERANLAATHGISSR